LALQILDESFLRGKSIHVEEAKFELKGGHFDPTKRKKLTVKQIKQHKEKLNKWVLLLAS
jgi:hypothetical protein